MIAVGPEGGWSATEREFPGPVVSLGDTVLRAETAAILAGVLLVDRRRHGVRIAIPLLIGAGRGRDRADLVPVVGHARAADHGRPGRLRGMPPGDGR
ncbi:MAG: 16S rRNA (uracil(1498)-N(3))-methyltransferase [Chloroflexota bacterium]